MAPITKISLFLIQFYLLIKAVNCVADANVALTAPAVGTVEAGLVVCISKYGAEPNGDATQAIMNAWKEVCESTTPSKLSVPVGRYDLRAIKLLGPCKSQVTIEILGNFTAPADPAQFAGVDAWVIVERIDGLTITAPKGAGFFDGQGQVAWQKNACAQTAKCNEFPYNFRFNFVTNSLVQGITSVDSKLFHIAVLGGQQLKFEDITALAPAESINTDGIHIGRSDGVTIISSQFHTGDDCVSIGDGAKNVFIEKIVCGPGHGISIGSLGRYLNEETVENITVKGCLLQNTDNGVRVKTWLNSYKATAKGLHFEDITVENVLNPIIVDQEYCPFNHCKVKTPSTVKLSDIKFQNVRGTSSNKEAVQVICSSGVPCEMVQLIDIDLTYTGKDGPAVSSCKNVKPILTGTQNPPACDAPAIPVKEV